MKRDLLNTCLRALYAGRKYQLAIGAAIDCYEKGEHDTPANAKLISEYHREWTEATEEAIRLHELVEPG